MSSFFLLLLGFGLLFLGGELLVKSSVSLALRLKISTLFIGMTVVSFATSAPELFVSLQAVLQGSTNIALGNAIGSNIANITLVLGITAIIFRVQISKQTRSLNYPMMFFASIFFGIVLYFFNGIPVVFGYLFLILLFLFTIFLIFAYRKGYIEDKSNNHELLENSSSGDSLLKNLGLLLVGIFLLKYGADFLIDSATILASNFGVSDRIIAVTILAIGTSIPELATSIVAALRKEDSLAIGNLIGSNMFNILAVLGLTASIKSIDIHDTAIFSFDYFWMMITTLVVGLFIYVFSKQQISRREGIILVLIYSYYMYQTLKVFI